MSTPHVHYCVTLVILRHQEYMYRCLHSTWNKSSYWYVALEILIFMFSCAFLSCLLSDYIWNTLYAPQVRDLIIQLKHGWCSHCSSLPCVHIQYKRNFEHPFRLSYPTSPHYTCTILKPFINRVYSIILYTVYTACDSLVIHNRVLAKAS